jgi:hypothetical protein
MENQQYLQDNIGPMYVQAMQEKAAAEAQNTPPQQ